MARKNNRKARHVPIEQLVAPPEQALANGGYERKFVSHTETMTHAMTFVSSHDPVERWLRADRLTDSQMSAIALLRRLWRLAGLSQRVTATYGERMPGGCNVEQRAINEIEARQDLHRIQGYIPKPYFDVFENCCRHGMPAGVAGEALGFGSRAGDVRAHQIVCFVSDTVAMMERL